MRALIATTECIVRFRFVLWQFCLKEVKGRFAGSLMGLLWTVISPLSQIVIYYFLFSMVLKIKLSRASAGTDSFVLYFMCGLIPWIAFSDGLMRATVSIRENANLIQKVVFANEIVPCGAVCGVFLLNGVAFLLYMALLLFKGGHPSLYWLLVPGAAGLLLIFTLGMGFFFSALNVFVNDVIQLLQIGLMVWFYFTPILYTLDMVPQGFRFFMKLNPLFWFVTLFQELLLKGRLDPWAWAVSGGLALASMAVGSWLFSQLKDSFADFL